MQYIRSLLIAATAAALVACGGGGAEPEAQRITLDDDSEAHPAFHTAPILLDVPKQTMTPLTVSVPRDMMRVDTRLLEEGEIQTLWDKQRRFTFSAGDAPPDVYKLRVHSPAHIRMAYGLPFLPVTMDNLSPQQRADLGAGQTIFIITAYNHPNLLQDLETFNNTFGLPQCTQFYIPLNAQSLAPANPEDGCSIAIVHNNKVGVHMTLSAPKYNVSWARETAMDVQWAHAMAPLARIVVLQALNNFTNSLKDMVELANRFGPGTVNMSFVAGEGTYSERYEQFFNAPGMTYFAAAGDFGTQANWPATSPSVIAVGGTSLDSFNSIGARSERAWSRSGGGYSTYFPAPEYQKNLPVPTVRTIKQASIRNAIPRATADVSMNADPYTGQFVVFTPEGKSSIWYSMGGTSISSPSWAGITAVVNAQRQLAGKGPVGKFHQKLYAEIGPGVGAAARSLSDVVSGNNGSCALCTSQSGFDLPTGWGTPNVDILSNTMYNIQ